MEVRLTLQELAEIGSHRFPRVSCYGHRGEQVDNGRKWLKMVENGRKKVHRGYLVGNGLFACFAPWPSRWPGRQRQKMVENGRKWVAAVIW